MAARLRAIMAEFHIATVDELAEIVGANRSAVSNWVNAINLPRVPEMGRLWRDKTGLTLEFICTEVHLLASAHGYGNSFSGLGWTACLSHLRGCRNSDVEKGGGVAGGFEGSGTGFLHKKIL